MKGINLIAFAIVALFLIFLAGCNQFSKAPRIYPNKTSEVAELTQVDVIGMIDQDLINSTFISVKGVRLGDSAEAVVSKLGRPAGFEQFEDGILNLRFEDPKTKETEVIVHLENDKATRIAVKEGLIDELFNKSRFNYTKELATEAFGKPDLMYDTQFYHIYEYNDHGFEAYFKARKMVGYGFVPPK